MLNTIDWTEFWKAYKLWIISGVLGVVLIISALALWSWGEGALFRRSIERQQANINAKVDRIAEIEQEKRKLELEKATIQGELQRDTEAYSDAVDAHQQAKQETDRALANLAAASNSNSNVDASVEDLKRILEKLKQQEGQR